MKIFTSDPRDVILEVYVNNEFRPILSRSGNSVDVQLDNRPAPGTDIDCRVTLEVVLANRERRSQPTDLCAANFNVTVTGGIGGAASTSSPPQREPEPEPEESTADTPAAPIVQPPAIAEQPAEEPITPDVAEPDTPAPETDTAAPQSETLPPIQPAEPNAATVDPAQPLEPVQPPAATAEGTGEGAVEAPVGGEALSVAPGGAQPLASNENFVWDFSSGLNDAFLMHGVPETDNRDFSAQCTLQTGLIDVVVPITTPGLQDGADIELVFSAGDFAARYRGKAEMSDMDGVAYPRIRVQSNDPLWTAIIRESILTARLDNAVAQNISLKGSAAKTRGFVASCGQGATLPPVSGELGGPAGGGCQNLGNIRAPRSSQQTTLRFANESGATIQIYWLDYQGGQQFYATLQPGERYDQPSYVNHSWLVTTTDGGCLGVYAAVPGQNEIVVGAAPGVIEGGLRPYGDDALEAPAPGVPGAPEEPAAPVDPQQLGGYSTRFIYACDDGRTLQVTFDRQTNTARVAVGAAGEVTLFPARTRAGFRYVNQQYELRGQGPQLVWSDGGFFTQCFER